MDRRILLGLVIAFVVLIGLAWLLDANASIPSPTVPAGSVTATLAPLWSVDSASINLIRIEDPTKSTKVEIQKNLKGTWVIMDLTPVDADQTTVTNVLTNIAKITVFHDYGETLDPAEFGLARPSYLLTIKTADGKSFSLEIGALNPTATGYYVRIPGTKRIYTVRLALLSQVIGFLENKPVPPTITPTPTVTPTITMTPTVTNTGTIPVTVPGSPATTTPTVSGTPATATTTATVSGTPATATITPTISGTPGTAIPSLTLTPTP
jgi:hypothetical protein